jgi:hypothetical protein
VKIYQVQSTSLKLSIPVIILPKKDKILYLPILVILSERSESKDLQQRNEKADVSTSLNMTRKGPA